MSIVPCAITIALYAIHRVPCFMCDMTLSILTMTLKSYTMHSVEYLMSLLFSAIAIFLYIMLDDQCVICKITL